MKLGTQIILPDGRAGTVVYNSLIGVGIVWGLHNPDFRDFVDTDGNCTQHGVPDGWNWEPDALLRDPWPWCSRYGFSKEQCVGDKYEVTRDGLVTHESAIELCSEIAAKFGEEE